MTTLQDRVHHETYVGMNEREQAAVNDAYLYVRQVLVENDFKAARDDRAEALIGAIARYLEESNPKEEETYPSHEPIPQTITFNNHSREKDICGVCGKDVGYFCERNRWEHV